MMKLLIASLAALGLMASPALAATTTAAKVTPTAAKGTTHAKVKMHRSRSNAAMAQAGHKKAPARPNAKKTG